MSSSDGLRDVMSLKHIFMVTHYFPEHGGGVERVAGNLAKALVCFHGFKITWMASGGDAMPSLPTGVTCVDVRAWNVAESRFGIPFPVWRPGAFLGMWREIRHVSVVYVHDFLYIGSLVACFFAVFQKKPLVITQHIGLVPYRNSFLRGLLSVLNRTLGGWALRKASCVVFESDAVRAYFETFVRFSASPITIYNGLDTRLFKPCPPDVREKTRMSLGIPHDQPLFLFVGRFVEKKGLHILRELASRLKNCQWLFVGRGPLHPAAWRFPNVRILNPVSPEALVPLYQAADLLILPSKGEGFPLVVQEAMACGTPVMVGCETAAAAQFEPGLILSADVNGSDPAGSWCGQITHFLSSGSELAEMRQRVATYAHAHWSWDKCAAAYAATVFAPIIDTAHGKTL